MINSLMTICSYLSVVTLTIGALLFFRSKPFFFYYVIVILVIEILSFFGTSNLSLFSISYYLHFFFLTKYIIQKFFNWNRLNLSIFLGVMTLPMIYTLIANHNTLSFKSYDRILYNFLIVLVILFAMYSYLKRVTGTISSDIFFLFATLVFFSLDFILALSTNYLIRQKIKFIEFIWLFRVICLILFYISVVYLMWKTKENTSQSRH